MSRKTVYEIVAAAEPTDAEASWARAMGSDHRRAWETAPTASMLCMLAGSLASPEGHVAFLRALLDGVGLDGAQLERLAVEIHGTRAESRAVLELVHHAPGRERPQDALARELRARIDYDLLTTAGLGN